MIEPNLTQTEQKPLRARGIYLLPNLFTLAAIFSGFYSIVTAMRGYYGHSAVAIFIAILMDALDGRLARLLSVQTEFGGQLDSLSDMICFGLAPALVLYTWTLAYLGKPGWLIAFFYMVCSALRLARYNVQAKKIDRRYFQGLATPAAAFFVASAVLVCNIYGVDPANLGWPAFVVASILGLLKVSTIRYRSFKDFNLKNRVSFLVILLFVLILVFVAFDPPDILLLISFLYIISGPLGTIWALHKRRRQKKIKFIV